MSCTGAVLATARIISRPSPCHSAPRAMSSCPLSQSCLMTRGCGGRHADRWRVCPNEGDTRECGRAAVCHRAVTAPDRDFVTSVLPNQCGYGFRTTRMVAVLADFTRVFCTRARSCAAAVSSLIGITRHQA
jgi:hypothetical protein